jgi:hypothetical protein
MPHTTNRPKPDHAPNTGSGNRRVSIEATYTVTMYQSDTGPIYPTQVSHPYLRPNDTDHITTTNKRVYVPDPVADDPEWHFEWTATGSFRVKSSTSINDAVEKTLDYVEFGDYHPDNDRVELDIVVKKVTVYANIAQGCTQYVADRIAKKPDVIEQYVEDNLDHQIDGRKLGVENKPVADIHVTKDGDVHEHNLRDAISL